MSPAVVLGEHLAESAWPVGDGAVADLAARYWKTGNGHRERRGPGLLITFMMPSVRVCPGSMPHDHRHIGHERA